jgi:hypothetical protein
MTDTHTVFSDETDLDWLEEIATARSRQFNALLGGDPSMTFSCRSYRSSLTAPGPARRAGWRLVVTTIDLFCVWTRGEIDHCAAADRNHRLTQS